MADISPMGGKTTMEDISHDAETATAIEKSMGLLEAIRKFPKAFDQRLGNLLPDGTYQLTASWQSGLQNGTQVGQILGLLFAGLLAERFGYRKTLVGALFMTIGLIFLFFFAQNIGMLFAAEMLCGLPWGRFADANHHVCGRLNMCWVIGQFLATGVLRGLLGRADNWAWRIPYAVQWVFPPFIIVGILFAPESPLWLVRKSRIEEAHKALRKLISKSVSDTEIEQTVAMYVHTNALEKSFQEGTSYWDCLRGPNRRRTETACCVWIAQVACGIWYGGNVIYFLEQAGFDSEKAFDFGVGEIAIALVGTIIAWFIIPRLGRRTLFLTGLTIMFTILMAVGFMGIPMIKPGLCWASGALMMVFVLSYDMTVGPVCYCLVAEIPSTRPRIKTVVLARNAYLIASLVANFLNPPILDPTAWNLRGKGGFIWAGICLVILV
ncbi:hypothetical protein SCUCBS95973_008795 [Sporothrix curviconia]|uniref:Major facilitator superfamily (MFS) profile domain-containing protein n=1 Tax=Sporothrix curviconia TaxID=1260050 RepID=A0ABP0CR14_9PEZI